MKKKITYILSLLMIVCMLGACGSDNAEKTYGGYTTDELHTEATAVSYTHLTLPTILRV